MAQIGRLTIDLKGVNPLIHFQYCEKGLSLLDIVRHLRPNHNIQVTARTLTLRLQVWAFTKYTLRIPATMLVTLQGWIVQLFYHYVLTDKKSNGSYKGKDMGKSLYIGYKC